ncbi:endonuclease/exonuclease/phosphatase family protein [Streptomyces megasporus]|uniref:endonuclease/exonuclease/phosphatase family protein n=1 Tax=Streptomyces megasporus TaxID=44060 RepID=UPI000560E76D|nr:endonuclease/exonuclease/phosphatase family protein [Streptomyces megasporus]
MGPNQDAGNGTARTRGRLPAALAVASAAVPALHSLVPDAGVNLGSLLETFLPWTGLAVLALPAAVAARRRSVLGTAALLLPATVWLVLCHDALTPRTPGAADLTVVQHNVNDVNPDHDDTARALAEAGADLIALEEVTRAVRPVYETALAPDHPHHAVVGTVGLWSRHPLTDVRPLDIRPEGIEGDWRRGLRATVRTPHGDVAVHVAHLPSVRVRSSGFDTAWRDESAILLGRALAAEEQPRVLLLGDFNATLDDRGLAPVLSRLDSTGKEATDGFAFSWPTSFPVARIDHVMARGATVTHLRTLPATGSDHLPVEARVVLSTPKG